MIVLYHGRRAKLSAYLEHKLSRGRCCTVVSIGPSGSLPPRLVRVRVDAEEPYEIVVRDSQLYAIEERPEDVSTDS